uniref:Secreted protein n=1 Tax=Ascaris lumbricoides TaxID=6252 RepID=A0A0M3HVR3_ASCLU
MNAQQYCHLGNVWVVCFLSFISTGVYGGDELHTVSVVGTASRPYVNANGGNPVLFPSTTGNQQQLSGYLRSGHHRPQAVYYGAQRLYNTQPAMTGAPPYRVGSYGVQQYTVLQGNRGLQVNAESRLLPHVLMHTCANTRPLR